MNLIGKLIVAFLIFYNFSAPCLANGPKNKKIPYSGIAFSFEATNAIGFAAMGGFIVNPVLVQFQKGVHGDKFSIGLGVFHPSKFPAL